MICLKPVLSVFMFNLELTDGNGKITHPLINFVTEHMIDEYCGDDATIKLQREFSLSL